MDLQSRDVVYSMAGLAIAKGVVGLLVGMIGFPGKHYISALEILFLGPF